MSHLDLNIQDKYGFTVLMVEVIRNELNAVELLLELGANTELENDAGETALIFAIEEGYYRIVELLCIYGDVEHVNKHGDKPAAIARYYGNKDVINILETFGAKDDGKYTNIEKILDDWACG